MNKWTKEQLEAIETRNKNLLISAGAGSGKTAVLVERILKLVKEEAVDLDKFLIVTFTNAAAGEMRERILRVLMEELDKEENEHLRRQVSLVAKASISTLHSFCINIVRRNFSIVDLDPAFRVADEMETALIIQEIMEEMLEEHYEIEDDRFMDLVDRFTGNRRDTELEDLILKVHKFIQSQPNPMNWLKSKVEEMKITKEEVLNSMMFKLLEEEIEFEIEDAIKNLREAIEISNEVSGPKPYEAVLKEDLNNIIDIKEARNDESKFRKLLENISYTRLPSIRKGKDEVDEELQEEARSKREKYKDSIKEIKKASGDISLEDQVRLINDLKPAMEYLSILVEDFSKRYTEKKLEKGIVDFNDLEHYALEILEHEDVARDLRKKYSYIFIDEYQDSNIVQETIINKIKKDDNLFLVGDVKQSIYRFRLADPSLFLEKYKSYELDEKSKRVDLVKNFRSRKEILDFVNIIFSKIMSEYLGEMEYTEREYLISGRDFPKLEEAPVKIILLEKENKKSEENESELEELKDIEKEAIKIASEIRSLIDEEKETFNPKTGEFQKIDYSDIAVLLRSTRNRAGLVSEILRQHDIPAYCDDDQGYFKTLEIEIILNLLKVIDNKRQDIPLISVMRSMIGNFTTQELVEIRSNDKEGTFFEALKKYMQIEDELSEKIKQFLKKLDGWVEDMNNMSLDKLIWKIFVDTGYYDYMGLIPGGIQRQGNLRMLLDRAVEFEKTPLRGLFNFIRFVEKLKKADSDMGVAKILGENENLVRIMSIHKSKGLEFPVVFIPSLGKGFNLMDLREKFMLHKDLGLGMSYINSKSRQVIETLPQKAIRKKKKRENLSEEMRILYVGLTRAIDRLYLIGSMKDVAEKLKEWSTDTSAYVLERQKSMLDWIISGSKSDCGNKEDVLFEVFEEATIVSENLEREKERQKLKEILSNGLEDDDIDLNLKAKVDEIFSHQYKYEGSDKVPSKVSVTYLKNKLEGKEKIIKELKSWDENQKIRGATLGTLYHKVIEKFNLSREISYDALKNHIEDMLKRGFLSLEEAGVIDLSIIKSFFESELGERIRISKRVFRELPFVYKTNEGIENNEEDFLVQGIVDCLFEEDEKFILVDYKTDQIDIQEGGIIPKEHEFQLKLYKRALEEIWGIEISEGYISFLRARENIRIF